MGKWYSLFACIYDTIFIEEINLWYIISPFTDNTFTVTFVKGDFYI